GSMYVDVVSELHDEFSGNGRRWRPIGDSVSVFGFVAAAQSEYALDPPFQCLFSISAVVESLGAVQTQVDEVGGDFLGVRPGGGMGERQRYPMASQHLDHPRLREAGLRNSIEWRSRIESSALPNPGSETRSSWARARSRADRISRGRAARKGSSRSGSVR